VTLDDELAAAIRRGWRTAELTEGERAMMGYVEKLTKDAPSIGAADLDELRAHGFGDTAIVQINLIASFFNYINRVADGLGVGR
jgi:uncharacterized peroxidase-related enzyme